MSRASGRRNPTRPSTTGDPGPGSPAGKEIGESARQDPAGAPINSDTGNVVNYETVRQQVAIGEPREEHAGWLAHGVPPSEDTTEERATAERGGPNLARSRKVAGEKPVRKPTPVPVYIVPPGAGSRPLTTMATAKLSVPAAGTEAARITGRDETRVTMYVQVENAPGSTSNVSVTPPAVPATGVAAQNTTGFPVQVVISANGATISNVSVNGTTVGTAAGTYVVPAYGAISVAYTVAIPTWAWTELGVPSTAPSGARVDHEVSALDVGLGALVKTGAGYQEIKGCQDELFAVSNDATPVTISIIYIYDLAGAL